MEQKIAVIGAGVMGQGIAHALARQMKIVFLVDLEDSVLNRARERIAVQVEALCDLGIEDSGYADRVSSRIIYTTNRVHAVQDATVVIEAIIENLSEKRQLLSQVEKEVSPHTMLTTNTSSLPITQIGEALKDPSRFLGLHFIMPAHLVPLVEVVRGRLTSEKTLDYAKDLCRLIGKEPVVVRKDSPGFISNRLQHALLREAYTLIEEGVATAQDIDQVFRLGFAARYLVNGPIEQKDLSGLDTHLAVAEIVYPHLSQRTQPPDLLKQMVAEGRRGLKDGQGFYHWNLQEIRSILKHREEQLIKAFKAFAQFRSN